MNNIALHIEGVCFSYESKEVLKHVSADIEQGHICFIMGNNGSGKTTLLKNVMGFLLPKSGEIHIEDNVVGLLDRKSISKMVSYVPQAININTDFSVYEYLSLGRTPYLGIQGKLSGEDFDIIEKYANRLGVASFYERSINKLSGGQKQMVAIAKSLIQETPLVIMDEPMSALDIGKQVELLVVLRELTKEGRTIVLTTHNPNHAISIESDACFLKDGTVVAFGRSKEIIQDILLEEVFGKGISLEHGKITDSVVFNTFVSS